MPAGAPDLTEDELDWLAAHRPDLLERYEDLARAELLALSEQTAPLPDSPGALAARCTSGLEAQRPHLDLIDAALARSLSGELDRIMIFQPPQVGKSRRTTEWGPAWMLQRNPDMRIVVASYAAELARRRGRFVRNLIRDHDLGLVVSADSAAADRWDLAGARGGMRTVGVGGGLTGEPADALLIDDPVKDREAADSDAIRRTTYDWYRDVAELRLGPAGFVVLMMTRWHEHDLAGQLLAEEGRDTEGGRWHVLTVPALAEDHQPRRDPLTGEPTGPCPCGRPPDEPHDELGRDVGEALLHPTMPREEYARRAAATRRTSPRTFNALLQQRPTGAEGGLVSYELLRELRAAADTVPMMRRRVVALDPSGGGSDEAGVVAGGLGVDRRAWITHDRSGRMTAQQWGRAACELAHETHADAFVVERNYGGDQAKTIVRQAWDALALEGRVHGLCPQVVEVTAKKAKVVRAEPVAQAMREDRVRLAGLFLELEDQWATYQQGQDSPDRLDASAYLVLDLLPLALSGEARVTSPAGRVLPARVAGGQVAGGRVR